jgi:hypothetical protein
MPTEVDPQTGHATLDDLLRSQKDHLAADPDSPPVQPPPAVQDSGWNGPEPAVVIPTDTGFVTIRPQMEAVDTANESDLESILTVAEWEKLEDVSNLHEFPYHLD